MRRQMPTWLAKLILTLALPVRRRTILSITVGTAGILSIYLLFILLIMRERGIGREQLFGAPAVFLDAALFPLLLIAILVIPALVLAVLTRLSERRYYAVLGGTLTQFGLSGGPFLEKGWQYYGTLNGRQVDVIAILPRRSSGRRTGPGFTGKSQPHVAFSTRATHQATFTLMPTQLLDKQSLERGFKCLEVESRGFEGMTAVTSDVRWGNRLLADPSAKAALKRLCSGNSSHFWSLVALQPGMVTFLNYFKQALPDNEIGRLFAPDQVRQWIEDVQIVAGTAEKLPTPSRPAQMPSETDFLLRRNPGITSYAVGLVLGLIVVIWVWTRIIAEYVALP
jgi:hypothetical protein